MKLRLCVLAVLGMTSFGAPAFACNRAIDLNPGAPPFVPGADHMVSLNKFFRLEVGAHSYFRLGLLAPDDRWEIRFATGDWSDILHPIETEHLSARAMRDGEVITLHLTGKAPDQTSFDLAYFSKKKTLGAATRRRMMPIVVQVLPRPVHAPPVMIVEGDVAGRDAPTDGSGSFFIRLPPPAPHIRWEVGDAVWTTSSPRAETPAPWEPMGSGPTKAENGDFRVLTPPYGTMRLVFVQKGEEGEEMSGAITVTLAVPPRPKC